MKQFFVVAALCCLGSAIALPLLDSAVKNGVLLEETASRPTFAKGIRTYCDYMHHTARTLGAVPAAGDENKYSTIEKAKAICDELGDDCGGILEDSDVNGFTVWKGHHLKVGTASQTIHLKTLCAFPLPNTNFRPGSSTVNHNAIYEINPQVEDLRWKLSNGPVISRHDDKRDHGWASRIVDGKSNVAQVEDCMEICKGRSDCASGHYCAEGSTGTVGNCFLSGDWDPHGKPVDDFACSKVQNFRKRHDWVKPVMRTDDGQYIKHQWHSKRTIDDAAAMDQLAYDADEAQYGDGYDEKEEGAAL